MFSNLSSLARSGVIALAALASVPAAAPAAPLGPVGQPAVADSPIRAIPVAQGEGRDCGPGYGCGRRNWNRGGWNGRQWNRGWRGRHYARDGYWRRPYYRHGWRGNYWPGTGFALGLGLGVPLGYYGGYYNAPPVYRPRVYRGANSHVEWCYSRYRSYRAWDNTYQPYNGPRRQCYSPYS